MTFAVRHITFTPNEKIPGTKDTYLNWSVVNSGVTFLFSDTVDVDSSLSNENVTLN